MAEAQPTKVCPLCAEPIKAAAKICPYCHTKQGRYVLLGEQMLMVAAVVFPIVVALVAIHQFAPITGDAGGRSFAGHRDDLVVLNTSVESIGSNQDFWLTGTVTNVGEHPWRVQELEVRFVDDRGGLLDVRHADIKDSFVVGSRQENGFRVELGRLSFTNGSVTRQVRVQLATDGDQPVKAD